jgi:hypothetical protein
VAFDGLYQVSVVLTHPTFTEDEIALRLPTLVASRQSTVGKPHPPHGRLARNSVWVMEFHAEFVESEDFPLSDTLRRELGRLTPYRHVFTEIAREGEAYLQIVWFAHSSHSVVLLDPGVVALIAETGLCLDVEYYAPDRNESAVSD